MRSLTLSIPVRPIRLVACVCIFATAISLQTAAAGLDVKSFVPSTQSSGPVETCRATDQPLKTAGASPEMAERLKAFDHPVETFDYSLRLVTTEETLRFYWLVFPSPYQSPWPENNVVPCELYLPRKVGGKIPAAIVLDVLDGSSIVPRGIARGMAEQGIAALYVPMAFYNSRKPKNKAHIEKIRENPVVGVDAVRQTVMDIRRARSILASRPEVDPDRIGIAGVSLGGIVTSLAAGVDGTFARVVPILAGGDLAGIAYSARETRGLRTEMALRKMTRADVENLVAPVEPLRFASRIDPAACLMINAARDEVIPRASTDALRAAIGSPKILWAPVGHYASIFFLPNIRQRTIDFMLGRPVETLDLKPVGQ